MVLMLDKYLSLNLLSLQNLNEGTEDLKDEILARLSSCLLPMAKRHECYSTLWKICCDLNDSGLLRNLMVGLLQFLFHVIYFHLFFKTYRMVSLFKQ